MHKVDWVHDEKKNNQEEDDAHPDSRVACTKTGNCRLRFMLLSTFFFASLPTIIFGWYSILFRQFSFKWANPQEDTEKKEEKKTPNALVFNRKFMSPRTGYPSSQLPALFSMISA